VEAVAVAVAVQILEASEEAILVAAELEGVGNNGQRLTANGGRVKAWGNLIMVCL
jgi:hypothetical protein